MAKKNLEPLLETDTLFVSIETDELERVLNRLLTSPKNTITLTLMIEKNKKIIRIYMGDRGDVRGGAARRLR